MTCFLPVGSAPHISPWSPCSMGPYRLVIPTSAAWPAANRAIYIPFRLLAPLLVRLLWVFNGATVSGNVDVGIYDLAGTRLTSTGSTAQAGINTIQTFDITDITLAVNQYYLALAVDNTTATVFRDNSGAGFIRAMGGQQQASAFPLPATATFATVASGFIPSFGLTTRSFV